MSKTILRVIRSQIGEKVRFALINNPEVYQAQNIAKVIIYDGDKLVDSLNPDQCYYRDGSIDSPNVQDWIVNNGLYRKGKSPIGLVLCEFEEERSSHIYRILKVLNIKQQYKNPQRYMASQGLQDIISMFE
mgnify:CR=1 FL=1